MGQQSITPHSRLVRAPLWIALLLLLTLASASAQTSAVSALAAPLILPSAIVFDASGNLYFAETANHVIHKVDTTGNLTTIAGSNTQGFSGDGGPATAATLDSPQGLTLDANNNLYIADTHNHRIRKINLATGIITTIAGSTPGFSGDSTLATAAQLNLPTALAFDTSGNLYFADTGNHRIRKINASGIITTIAGTGTQGSSGDNAPAIAAAIDSPTGLALDAANNLYLADTHNHRIRKINVTTGIIATIAGTGSPGFSGDNAAATTAALALPQGLTIDSAGNLYLADTANHRIRRIDAATGTITTVAGDGTQSFSGDNGLATSASLDSPRTTTLSAANLLTLADTHNERIRQLDAAANIHTIAGLGVTTPGALTLTAPSVIAYGTGQITASLTTTNSATGSITFFDTENAITTTIGTVPISASIATFSTANLAAGLHSLTATYAGDQTHASAQSSSVALRITPLQLTASLTPFTLLYGQPIPALTGTLTGILPQDTGNLSATFTTTAATLSPTGTYPITVSLSGSAAGNYSIATPAATITITPAPTITTLSNLIANATTGSAIALTAHVASTTIGTPTGSITFLDNTTPLLTTALTTTGDAAFTSTTLSQGAHTLTAIYTGNSNFSPSTSVPQQITIGTGSSTPAPDFTLAATGSTTQTITSGNSANFTLTVQSQGNLSSPITLAATGLPNLATASFNPPSLPPGASNTVILTIATPNTTALKRTPLIIWGLFLIPIASLPLRRRNHDLARRVILMALLTLPLIFTIGCGDRVNTASALSLAAAKTYTITITGTATTATGSILQHSTTVTLTLQPAS